MSRKKPNHERRRRFLASVRSAKPAKPKSVEIDEGKLPPEIHDAIDLAAKLTALYEVMLEEVQVAAVRLTMETIASQIIFDNLWPDEEGGYARVEEIVRDLLGEAMKSHRHLVRGWLLATGKAAIPTQ